ncbi:MAG: hypothetical protein IJL32_09480 [Oscillospiraceae bacterium]|nr:hypothetical protein [Oscillospiraceae bacterium]
METHTLYCPKCGRELTVPFDTDAFYCTYCAAPLKMENGTLHAGLTGSLPQHQEQNPFRPDTKCIKFYLLSFAAAAGFGALSSFLGAKFSWIEAPLFAVGILADMILLVPTISYDGKHKNDIAPAVAFGLVILLMNLITSDFVRRLIRDAILYR